MGSWIIKAIFDDIFFLNGKTNEKRNYGKIEHTFINKKYTIQNTEIYNLKNIYKS